MHASSPENENHNKPIDILFFIYHLNIQNMDILKHKQHIMLVLNLTIKTKNKNKKLDRTVL